MNARGARWLVLAVLAAVACEDKLNVYGRPCPCVEGFECCASVDSPYCAEVGHCPAPPTIDRAGPDGHGASYLATDQSPQCMAQDEAHVYWVNDDGRLFGAPKDGGGAVGSRWIPPGAAPISSLLPAGCKLVIDGGYAYTTLPSLGKIARVSLFTNGVWDIGNEGLLFGDLSLPSSLSVDANAVFVTQSDTALLSKLPRPPLSGADAGSPDAGSPDGGAGASFNQRTAPRPSELVEGPDALYWFDGTGLRRMDKSGGTIATVVINTGAFLALSGTALYWRQSADEAPFFVPASGGSAAQVPWQAWTDFYNAEYHGVDFQDSDALTAAADKTGCQKGATGGDEASVGVSISSDAGASEGSTLAVNDHELVFSTDTHLHRVSIPGGTVEDMFTYRGACSGSSSSNNSDRARIVLVDSTQVFWADMTTVWRHPRN